MSTMLGDEVLRAAPANYVELEKVIAQYSNSASDEELRIARARLQTVAAADAALKLAQHHGTIPQQRLAIEQHSSRASPPAVAAAEGALASAEAATDAALAAALASEVDCLRYGEIIASFEVDATHLERLHTRISSTGRLVVADDVFTNAIKTARGSDNTEEDRTALQKAIDVASDPQSGLRCSPRFLSEAIELHADLHIKAVPRDSAEPIRRVLNEYGERASELVAQEARAQLRVLDYLIRSCRKAISTANDPKELVHLRPVMRRHSTMASAELTKLRPRVLRRSRRKRTASLAEQVERCKQNQPNGALAEGVRALIEAKRSEATPDALEEAERFLAVVERRTQRFERRMKRQRRAAIPIRSRRPSRSGRVILVASTYERAEDLLVVLEADEQLQATPLDYAMLQHALEKYGPHASESVRTATLGRLDTVSRADAVFKDASSVDWHELHKLRAVLAEFAKTASPKEVEAAQERLAALMREADLVLERGVAKAVEAPTIRGLISHFRGTATDAAITRAEELLAFVEAADKELIRCMELDMHEYKILMSTIAKLRELEAHQC